MSYLINYIEHYADELEEVLDDAILHDFNVEAEDGSPRQASEAALHGNGFDEFRCNLITEQ